MYKIEKIGDNIFYIKFMGKLPKSKAENYIKDLRLAIKGLSHFSILVDLLDATFLSGETFDFLLDLFKKDNKRLIKSAYVISENPPLDVEFQYLFDQAPSPKRKIVSDLDDAKKWLGISEISIQYD